MRYAIVSAALGLIGGLSFSAAAWRLSCRDRFIGWTEAARREHLQSVVGNSRFLVHPGVRCPNLASHALGIALRQMASDWSTRHGYAPVLVETFIDARDHAGTCYAAAGFQWVGKTAGRGRKDRTHTQEKSPKWVYVRPLIPDWRKALGVDPGYVPAVDFGAPAVDDWARRELWAYMGKLPVAGRITVEIPERGARPARQALLSVRFGAITIEPPEAHAQLKPMVLCAVYAREVWPAKKSEAVDWMLLTTVSTETFAEAVERIRWYRARSEIEVFHRTLKAGCCIEDRQLEAIDRVAACLAIDMVVAWHVLYLRTLSREQPDTLRPRCWRPTPARSCRFSPPGGPGKARRASGRRCEKSPDSAGSWGASATASPGPQRSGAVCSSSGRWWKGTGWHRRPRLVPAALERRARRHSRRVLVLGALSPRRQPPTQPRASASGGRVEDFCGDPLAKPASSTPF
ncbi:MAG: DUF4338 domain-containing protein [Candidatus Schekmanbacteria bacterium]|nr:DUF4338 domain-containing protein [Candidatus Schekmanbacteria bacterium]